MKARIDLQPQPIGKFAVVRHSRNAKRIRFAVLHDDYESARKEAQRLTACGIEADGPGVHNYYIVELVGRVGIFDGVLEDGARR